MITIRGIHKVMGMEGGDGWRITHISETPKDYIFKLIRERRVYNPNTFGIGVKEEETDIILSREGGYLMCEGGFKFGITDRGIHNIQTFLKALSIVVTALQFDTPNS
jgi:hypothetical protein